MHTRGVLAAAAAAALICAASGQAQQATPDLSSPESSVRGFFAAYNTRRVVDAAAFVSGATVTDDLRAFQADLEKGPSLEMKATVVGSRIGGETAEVDVDVSAAPPGVVQPARRFVVKLRKEGAAWKLTPPTRAELEKLHGAQADRDLVHLLTDTVTNPSRFLNARAAARKAGCSNNLKQLAIAMEILVLDWDYVYAIKANAWKGRMMAYVKNERAFRCPLDSVDGKGPVTYAFNHNLEGKSVANLKAPERTILFYEGSKGRLSFRHDGLAGVALADGTARMVDAKEAATLRWLP